MRRLFLLAALLLGIAIIIIIAGWRTYMPSLAPQAFFDFLNLSQTVRPGVELFWYRRYAPPMQSLKDLYGHTGRRLVISATTSPYRLKASLGECLAVMAPIAHEIHLNLPDLYKNSEAYDSEAIAELQRRIGPALKIFRVGLDIGPATKIVPTLERLIDAQAKARAAAESGGPFTMPHVFSLDDDTWYSPNDVLKIVQDPANDNAVVSGHITMEGDVQMPFGVRGIVYGLSLIHI